ncbi:MAG: hypothetical protein HQL39_16885 [Alphaproteobacteria bacterium]|nr:hypothetical protein [Alphaproteobacteria bacterium]
MTGQPEESQVPLDWAEIYESFLKPFRARLAAASKTQLIMHVSDHAIARGLRNVGMAGLQAYLDQEFAVLAEYAAAARDENASRRWRACAKRACNQPPKKRRRKKRAGP